MKTLSKQIKLKRAQKIPTDDIYHNCRFCKHYDLSRECCAFHFEFSDDTIKDVKDRLIKKLADIVTSEVWHFSEVEKAINDVIDSAWIDDSYSNPRDYYCSEWE